MGTDVSSAIATTRDVLALDAARGCALGLRPRGMAPSGSTIRAVAISSPDS
ncbi:MAG TPA: hypothetical protein VI916_07580 [Acidimicrobiia bacterium]|nr:hypothetical protein [Acidimicrobiia bacterium]